MSNDAPTVLYVTYRGEASDQSEASSATLNQNVDVIDQHGFVATQVLDTNLPDDVGLDELRGLCFGPDGYMWVVSGARATSLILRFNAVPVNGVHQYHDKVASPALLDSTNHPFDVAFNPETGDWFVSNQDTNVAAGPFPPEPVAPPFPLAPYLKQTYPSATFWNGTFVASAKPVGPTHDPPIQLVPTPQGLDAELKPARHSVRGVAHDGRLLYVADEQADAVKAYDSCGRLAWAFPQDAELDIISEPVHLLLAEGGLLIGSSGTGSVVYVHPAGGAPDAVVVRRVLATEIDSLSGLAVDAAHTLYVASRKARQVYSVPDATSLEGDGLPTPQPWSKKLNDEPEFIVVAPEATAAAW
jgi:hypothetical protein